MSTAYKTFAQCPLAQKPREDVPNEMVWQAQTCLTENDEAQAVSDGFVVVSDADYAAYIESIKPQSDAWLFSYQVWLSTNQKSVAHSVAKTKAFSESLIDTIKTMNVTSGGGVHTGIWFHHRMKSAAITVTQAHANQFPPLTPLVGVAIVIDVMNLVASGDLESIYGVLCCLDPDDMTQPYHCITQGLIDFVKYEIANFLGWV